MESIESILNAARERRAVVDAAVVSLQEATGKMWQQIHELQSESRVIAELLKEQQRFARVRRDLIQARWDNRRLTRMLRNHVGVSAIRARHISTRNHRLAAMDRERFLGELRAAATPYSRAQAGAGIYFLFQAERLIYIGQSVNVAQRVATHATTRSFDAVVCIPCHKSRLDYVERALIDAFLPAENMDSRTHFLRKTGDLVDEPS